MFRGGGNGGSESRRKLNRAQYNDARNTSESDDKSDADDDSHDNYIDTGDDEYYRQVPKMNSDLFSRYNFLFWGREQYNETTGSYDTIFEGGRETAFSANVHMKYGRGRTSYVLDVNGDALLDIFVFQVRYYLL